VESVARGSSRNSPRSHRRAPHRREPQPRAPHRREPHARGPHRRGPRRRAPHPRAPHRRDPRPGSDARDPPGRPRPPPCERTRNRQASRPIDHRHRHALPLARGDPSRLPARRGRARQHDRLRALSHRQAVRLLLLLHLLQPRQQALRPPPPRHPARAGHPLLARRASTPPWGRYLRGGGSRHPHLGQGALVRIGDLADELVGRQRDHHRLGEGTATAQGTRPGSVS
jgi:hypothetical protein